jgi:LysM repeat protein
VNRRWAARLLAPAAFLAGVTVAVVLVRAGLSDANDTATTTAAVVNTSPTTTAKKPKPKPAVYATVESGDTLDQIALDNDTTVERIVELNPGLDPNGLQVGQKVRVR